MIYAFLLLSGLIFLSVSSHHTRTRSYLFVCHPTSCFAQKRKPRPPTPKHPPTCTHIPQPCSLPLITGSALPWLLLLLPWKSSTNPVERLCVLDLRRRQESRRPIICYNSSEGKGLVVIMRKYLEEQHVSGDGRPDGGRLLFIRSKSSRLLIQTREEENADGVCSRTLLLQEP